MDNLTLLMEGFSNALTLQNLLFALIGVLLGTAVGVLPGIGPAMTVALLLPLTYALDVTGSLIMFAGIYYGGMYGGSTTSILLNTPGESSSVVTALEGNKMAKAGRGAQALATAAIGSFVAGTLATGALVFVAPFVVAIAIGLGAPSYFAMMVFAFIAVSTVLGSSRIRGLASLFIGLTIGLVGLDGTTGQPRLTFGQPLLSGGIDVVVIAVALFAVGEALWIAAHLRHGTPATIPVGVPWMRKDDWKRSWKPWLRGTVIGFPFGAIPAGGAEIPTFLSYVTEKKLSKHPEQFGHGAIEGVAGPEAANNASAAGTLVPLLTLGLPTTATAAVMIAAFNQYGIHPGPLLFQTEPILVWTLIASLFIGNTIGLVGLDATTGQPRLTFGQPLLSGGIDVVVIAVALFAVGEALWIAAHLRHGTPATIPVGVPWMRKDDWKRSWKPWLRGTVIGFPFGAIPAGGAEIPTFLSYVTEKKLSKHPEQFGHGAIEGVAGPEAANNASAAGTLVPLLTLGLPTTATAAVMILAFNQYGIHPGPLLFQTEPILVWTLIASLFIGNTLLLALNLPLAPLWAKLLRIPRPYLYAGILFFATLGAYAAGMQTFNIGILLLLGALGYMARRFGFPVLPIIVGAILGPEMERQLRRALQISAGDPAALVSEPVAVVVYTVIVLFLIGPPLVKALRRRFGRGGPTDGPLAGGGTDDTDGDGAEADDTVELDTFGTQTSDGSARVIRVVRSKVGRREK